MAADGVAATGLLFVSVEQANTSEFSQWANRQAKGHQTLRQIVVDEAHTPLLASSYRPAMLNVSAMRRLGVRVVLLSGTVPEPLVPQLRHAFGCMQLRVYRDDTDRPNLRYQVSS
jgi:superfamily II DNA helicase RecQ